MDCCEFILAATGAADSSPLWVDIVAWLFIIVFGFFIVAMVVLLTLMWILIELEWLLGCCCPRGDVLGEGDGRARF